MFYKLTFSIQYPLWLPFYFHKFMRRKMNLHSMMLSASKQWCERQQQQQQPPQQQQQQRQRQRKTDTKNRAFHFSFWIIVPYKIMDIYAAIIFYHQREIQLLKWMKSVRRGGRGLGAGVHREKWEWEWKWNEQSSSKERVGETQPNRL